MQVSVAYADNEKQVWLHIELPQGATVLDALQQSGILARFPHIDLNIQKVGIHGKLVELEQALKEDDRVEIYRSIIADKNEVSWRNKDAND